MAREFQFTPIATVTVADDGAVTLEIDWSASSEGEWDEASCEHINNAAAEVVSSFLTEPMLPGTRPMSLGQLDPALLASAGEDEEEING